MAASRRRRVEHCLLWPATPIDASIQQRIKLRMGVSDMEVDDPRSRPRVVLSVLEDLLRGGALRAEFSMLDVCCGDARILMEVQRRFGKAWLYGLDCNVGRFASHDEAASLGVELYGGFIQELFIRPVPEKFDVVMMLNTFRDWEAARLRVNDRALPKQAEAWLLASARYVLVTANPEQVQRLKKQHRAAIVGPGEEDSQFLLIES
jgi:hypothetical protein